MCICDLKPGQKASVSKIIGDEKLKKRLNALGCIEGTVIELKNSAPFGDPLVLNLRGFNLAIRKNDAKNIFINGGHL
jgi:ferrous iron transport protein A